MLFQSIVASVVWVLPALAVDIRVKSSEGNYTGRIQYGFLHEDIDNSGDGGIYAELIRNRAFQHSEEYPVSLDAWSPIGGADLTLDRLHVPLSEALPVSMKVAKSKDSKKRWHGSIGFSNDGYWGMDVKRQKYTGSFWVKGLYHGLFKASLRSNLTNEVFGSVEVKSESVQDDWTEHTFELWPKKDAPNSNNTFAITFDPFGCKDGSLDFNLISLFPPTYKNRENGLRVDLAEALEELHPTIIRFPGGNMLEGLTNDTIWDWKNSIGPLRNRTGFQGVWGYQQTNGLGMMEYLYWAEDMGLDFILAVWDGLALDASITPKDELQPYIDDALDEIEFVTGPVSSHWGSVRASLGHPEPFPLKWVEVGNEDNIAGSGAGWPSYKEYRFPMFLEAINKAYPEITVVSSGPVTAGYDIPPPGIGDYHAYLAPDEFIDTYDLFDNIEIDHIVGEVAATFPNGGVDFDGPLMPYPFWIGTVGEAVALLGYERNADRVHASLYAPVLRNMNRWQWSVTILQFAADPKLTTRSTSWYTWELLAAHPIDETLSAKSSEGPGPLYYVSGKNHEKNSFVWKGAVYNTTDGADLPVSITMDGAGHGEEATLTVLSNKAGDPFAYNDPFTGINIVDSETKVIKAGHDGAFNFKLPDLSVAVLETKPRHWDW